MSIGFKRSQIIDTAHRRTNGRAKSLDVDAEYATAAQEVALERRWWWRRKIVPFTIAAGTATYQLTGDTGSLGMDDFQQAQRGGFKVYGPGLQFSCLDPVFDMDEQDTIVALQAQAPVGRPNRYFIIGAPGEMRVDPISDADYPASLAHWTIPIFTPGAEDEVVTSIPAYLHTLLIKRLEMHFLSFSVTEEASRYKVAALEYAEMLANATLYRNFAEGEVKSFVNADSSDSVRSS